MPLRRAVLVVGADDVTPFRSRWRRPNCSAMCRTMIWLDTSNRSCYSCSKPSRCDGVRTVGPRYDRVLYGPIDLVGVEPDQAWVEAKPEA